MTTITHIGVHHIELNGDARKGYRAICSCGWRSGLRFSTRSATDAAMPHRTQAIKESGRKPSGRRGGPTLDRNTRYE